MRMANRESDFRTRCRSLVSSARNSFERREASRTFRFPYQICYPFRRRCAGELGFVEYGSLSGRARVAGLVQRLERLAVWGGDAFFRATPKIVRRGSAAR